MGASESCCAADPEILGTDGMLPPPDVLTHDILLQQHQFAFDRNDECLLSVDCCPGTSPDPLNGKPDHYVAFGLSTKFDGQRVEKYGRPQINLIIAIDVSGSMNAHFKCDSESLHSKLDVVKDVILGKGGLLESLRPTDKIAIVTFGTDAKVLQELSPVCRMLRDRVVGMMTKQPAVGSTNLSHALKVARGLIQQEAQKGRSGPGHPLSHFAPPPSLLEDECRVLVDDDAPSHSDHEAPAPDHPTRIRRADTLYCRDLTDAPENRVLVLTDERLGCEPDHEEALRVVLEMAERSGIHSTIVGIGVNHPPRTVRRMSAIAGCRSLCVHTAAALRASLVTELSHVLVPIAYDVSVQFRTRTPELVEWHGAATRHKALSIKTVFAGAGDAAVYCNVGIWRLAQPLTGRVEYTIRYVDRLGEQHSDNVSVELTDSGAKHCFRKSVALSRLGNLLRVFLTDEHRDVAETAPSITMQTGIIPLPHQMAEQEDRAGVEVEDVGSPTYSDPGTNTDQPLLDVQQGTAHDDHTTASCTFTSSPADAQLLPGDLDAHDKSPMTTPGIRPHASSKHTVSPMTKAQGREEPGRSIQLSDVSAHYKQILAAFADGYFSVEARESGDPGLAKWLAFLHAITKPISEDVIERVAERHLTDDALLDGETAESVYARINREEYHNGLRENHKRAVESVFSARMRQIVLKVMRELAAEHPDWLVLKPDILDEAFERLRTRFKHLEDVDVWARWKDEWQSLVDVTLRSVLNGRVFEVAKHEFQASLGQDLSPQEHGYHVLQAVAKHEPVALFRRSSSFTQAGAAHPKPEGGADLELSVSSSSSHRHQDPHARASPRDSMHSGAFDELSKAFPMPPAQHYSAQGRELLAFINRWMIPCLIKHNGACHWCYEQGVPLGDNEQEQPMPRATPQCPTQ
ncbi:hypothetical protein DIPPA_20605 [Diplonema papillatum]|nr:hypothetical protein DIPPA_20605 [Diplonema papillatum]